MDCRKVAQVQSPVLHFQCLAQKVRCLKAQIASSVEGASKISGAAKCPQTAATTPQACWREANACFLFINTEKGIGDFGLFGILAKQETLRPELTVVCFHLSDGSLERPIAMRCQGVFAVGHLVHFRG